MAHNRVTEIVLCLLLLAGGCFVFRGPAFTATESGNINVQYTVPSPSTPGDGGPSDNIPPVISNILTDASYTTATVSWVATDNVGVGYCSFSYGLTDSYGFSGATNVAGSNFYVNLDGLTTGTPYFFIITCADSSNLATATGTFVTLSPVFQNNLTILARPEKRVPKTGGNLDLAVTLLLYDAVTKQLMHAVNTEINSTGSSTVDGAVAGIPTGDFEAVLKGQSHLAKKVIGVHLENGNDTVIDFSDSGAYYLLAGDVQGTGLKDNFVDILDISAEDIKFNSTNLEFDLNRDNIVDVLDMSAILVNYNKNGDPIT